MVFKKPGLGETLVITDASGKQIIGAMRYEGTWRDAVDRLPKAEPLLRIRKAVRKLVGQAVWLAESIWKGNKHTGWFSFNSEASTSFRDFLKLNDDGSYEALVVGRDGVLEWKRVERGELLGAVPLHVPGSKKQRLIRTSGSNEITIGEPASIRSTSSDEYFRFNGRYWERLMDAERLPPGKKVRGVRLLPNGTIRFDGPLECGFKFRADTSFIVCEKDRSIWCSTDNPGWVVLGEHSNVEIFTDGKNWYSVKPVPSRFLAAPILFGEEQMSTQITPLITAYRDGVVQIAGSEMYTPGVEIDCQIGEVNIQRNAYTDGWILVSDGTAMQGGVFEYGQWSWGARTRQPVGNLTLRGLLFGGGPVGSIGWAVAIFAWPIHWVLTTAFHVARNLSYPIASATRSILPWFKSISRFLYVRTQKSLAKFF